MITAMNLVNIQNFILNNETRVETGKNSFWAQRESVKQEGSFPFVTF